MFWLRRERVVFFEGEKAHNILMSCKSLGQENEPIDFGLCLSQQLPVEYVVDNYRGTSKYCLGLINSIYIREGKIYNLLDKMAPRRRLRCGCVKSNCQAKYCQCFRAGETCGQSCGCIGCRNRKQRKTVSLPAQDQSGCNCVKSGCLKKYCECFQRGKKCGPYCGCSDCRNIEQEEDCDDP